MSFGLRFLLSTNCQPLVIPFGWTHYPTSCVFCDWTDIATSSPWKPSIGSGLGYPIWMDIYYLVFSSWLDRHTNFISSKILSRLRNLLVRTTYSRSFYITESCVFGFEGKDARELLWTQFGLQDRDPVGKFLGEWNKCRPTSGKSAALSRSVELVGLTVTGQKYTTWWDVPWRTTLDMTLGSEILIDLWRHPILHTRRDCVLVF